MTGESKRLLVIFPTVRWLQLGAPHFCPSLVRLQFLLNAAQVLLRAAEAPSQHVRSLRFMPYLYL